MALKSRKKTTRNDLTRVFYFDNSSRLGCCPVFLNCYSLDAISQESGDPENIYCPDPKKFSGFKVVDTIPAEKGRVSTTLTGRYNPAAYSFLKETFENGCPVELHVHFGECDNPSIFNNFDKTLVVTNAFFTGHNLDALSTFTPEDRAVINEAVTVSGEATYEFIYPSFSALSTFSDAVSQQLVVGEADGCVDCFCIGSCGQVLQVLNEPANADPVVTGMIIGSRSYVITQSGIYQSFLSTGVGSGSGLISATGLTEVFTADSNGVRVDWGETENWSASNPDWDNALSTAIGAGGSQLFFNTAELGIDVTVTGGGTHSFNSPRPDGSPAGILVNALAGDVSTVQLDFSSPQCILISHGDINNTEISGFDADADWNVTSNPHSSGVVVPAIITGNDTPNVTIQGVVDGDNNNTLLSADNVSTFTYTYTNNGAGAGNQGFGLWIVDPVNIKFYRLTTYSDGSFDIVNVANPLDTKSSIDGEWQEIDCDSVSITDNNTFTVNYMDVCADGAIAIRRVEKQSDGTIAESFETTDGAALTPVTWSPGKCSNPVVSGGAVLEFDATAETDLGQATSDYLGNGGVITGIPAGATGAVIQVQKLTGAGNVRFFSDGSGRTPRNDYGFVATSNSMIILGETTDSSDNVAELSNFNIIAEDGTAYITIDWYM